VLDEAGNTKRFSIVGVDETNVKDGLISWVSPVGKALLQAQKGDTVTIRSPKGEEDWEIQNVEYKAIPS